MPYALKSATLTGAKKAAVPTSGEKRYAVPNHPGLYLRVKSGGQRSWVYRIRSSSKVHDSPAHTKRDGTQPTNDVIQMGLGEFVENEQAVRDVLDKARMLDAWKRMDRDPKHEVYLTAEAKRAEDAAARGEGVATLGSFIDRWLEDAENLPKSNGHKRSPNTIRSYRILIEKRIKPTLGDQPITLLHYRDLNAFMREQLEGGLDPTSFNTLIVVLRGAFEIAKKEVDELDGRNPAKELNRVAPARKRNRMATEDELRWMWQAAGDIDFGGFGQVQRLVMLTGQRLNEIQKLRWDEVKLDGDEGPLLEISEDRMKNDETQIIPLSSRALEIIERQMEFRNGTFVFPNAAGNGPLSRESDATKAMRIRMAEIATTETGEQVDWRQWAKGGDHDLRTHDLRRNMAAICDDSGEVDDRDIEAMLGHTLKGIKASYRKGAKRLLQRRKAWQLWADHLMSVVEPATGHGEVIRMRA